MFGLPLNTTTNAQLYESPSSAAALARRTEAGLDRIYTPETTYQWLQERYFNLRAFPEGDWQDLQRLRDAAMPNLATAEGLYEVYNYDPLRLERPLLVMRAAEHQGFQSPLLDMLVARYMQTPAEPAVTCGFTAGNALVVSSWSAPRPSPAGLRGIARRERPHQSRSSSSHLRPSLRPRCDGLRGERASCA